MPLTITECAVRATSLMPANLLCQRCAAVSNRKAAAAHLQQAALLGLQPSQQAAQQLVAVLLAPTLQGVPSASSRVRALLWEALQRTCWLVGPYC